MTFILLLSFVIVRASLTLRPDSEPLRLIAHADALSHRIQLQSLLPGITYEVRVSYSASTPCAFKIQRVDDDDDASLSTGRVLLNAEKLLFSISQGDEATVEVLADLSDYLPAPNSLSNDVRQVPFLVALESTWHGAPRGAARLVALIVLLNAVVLCAWRQFRVTNTVNRKHI
jgi:hypothetical protein